MNLVCKKDMCTGCMACIALCPQKAIKICDSLYSYNAVIDKSLCVECCMCYRVCQVCNPVELRYPIFWKQGWAIDSKVRADSASGGYATAIAKAFIKEGAVCSCFYNAGDFGFKIAYSEKELIEFVGSKYVKSNPVNMYDEVRKVLRNGLKCLVIALPCQIAGLMKVVEKKYVDLLYTIDLICHGTPSPNLLALYLKQHKKELKNIKTIRFRSKHKIGLLIDTDKENYSGAEDSYMLAFLYCLSYTENCYSCAYAQLRRVSDLTLGDSWGTELSKVERNKGISIVLAQTEKGKMLLKKANIYMHSVNINRAIDANHQLQTPSVKPLKREFFFDSIKKNRNFDYIVFRIYTKQYLKQIVKRVLPYLGIKLR